jgi:hypothetical protein
LPGGFPHSWGSVLLNQRLDVVSPIAGSTEAGDPDLLERAGGDYPPHRFAREAKNLTSLLLGQENRALFRLLSHGLLFRLPIHQQTL